MYLWTRGSVVECRVWEDDYVAGSDHRLVSCVVKPSAVNLPVSITNTASPILPDSHCKIRNGGLKNPQLRAAAVRGLKAGRKQAKEAIVVHLGALCALGTLQSVEKYRGN